MKASASPVSYARFSDEAKAFLDTLLLHYRGELVEALLGGKVAPAPKKSGLFGRQPKRGVTELLMTRFADLSPRDKKAMARRLMRADLAPGRPMTAAERMELRRQIRPDSPQSFKERAGLDAKLIELMTGPGPQDDAEKRRAVQRFLTGVSKGLSLDTGLVGGPGEDEQSNDGQGDPPVSASSPGWRRLQFRVNRIFCFEETSGESGADEISYAGVAYQGSGAVNPPANALPGDVPGADIADIIVAGDFRSGEGRWYNPPTVLFEYDISDATMPHVAAMLFAMAETDPGGGFDDFLLELFVGLHSDLLQSQWALIASSALVVGATTIAAAATGGPIGAVIAGIIATVVMTIATIVQATVFNADDFFEPFNATLVISPDALTGFPFHGTDESERFTQTIQGDGGIYDITFHWKLRDFDPGDPGDQDPPVDADT